MKETPISFRKRTGLLYAPPAALNAIARPLRPREACPTLFRQPGPEGLRDLFAGMLTHLAPGDSRFLWLAARAARTHRRLATTFGAVAVLEPLRLFPCRTNREGLFLAVNRRIEDEETVLWVPPSAVRAPIAWNRLRNRDEALARLGRGYAEEKERVLVELNAYLEELSEMKRAGAPGPARPWCDLTAAERRRLLAENGVRPRWTRGR